MKTFAKEYEVYAGSPIVTVDEIGFKCPVKFDERFLPRILVDLSIFPSVSQVRKNRPDLFRKLSGYGWETLKVGKRMIDIVYGFPEEEDDI